MNKGVRKLSGAGFFSGSGRGYGAFCLFWGIVNWMGGNFSLIFDKAKSEKVKFISLIPRNKNIVRFQINFQKIVF